MIMLDGPNFTSSPEEIEAVIAEIKAKTPENKDAIAFYESELESAIEFQKIEEERETS